ncbi:hypothetical protein DPMN_149999 [Dreissena polymorpha]|uniref:Uncharacterized protein n=1 Tax=Dreissena polymorpha TaxID=45954 RepID=A0A9D4J1M2_DREPO|nr:hypothetical protein DPMN_149999 [Dreissena polymorpha]
MAWMELTQHTYVLPLCFSKGLGPSSLTQYSLLELASLSSLEALGGFTGWHGWKLLSIHMSSPSAFPRAWDLQA